MSYIVACSVQPRPRRFGRVLFATLQLILQLAKHDQVNLDIYCLYHIRQMHMTTRLFHLVMYSTANILQICKIQYKMLKIKHFSSNTVTESHRHKILQHLLHQNIVNSQNRPKMTLVMFYSHRLNYRKILRLDPVLLISQCMPSHLIQMTMQSMMQNGMKVF